MSDVAEKVRQFIVEELGWTGTPDQLTPELPLIEQRILDSIGLLTLVEYLEARYGIEVADSDIVPAQFGSIATIERYVNGKKA